MQQKYRFKEYLPVDEFLENMDYDELPVSQETYLRDLTISQ